MMTDKTPEYILMCRESSIQTLWDPKPGDIFADQLNKLHILGDCGINLRDAAYGISETSKFEAHYFIGHMHQMTWIPTSSDLIDLIFKDYPQEFLTIDQIVRSLNTEKEFLRIMNYDSSKINTMEKFLLTLYHHNKDHALWVESEWTSNWSIDTHGNTQK